MSATTKPLDDLAEAIFWEARLARFQLAMKAGFDPNQLRDDGGRWSDGAVAGVQLEDNERRSLQFYQSGYWNSVVNNALRGLSPPSHGKPGDEEIGRRILGWMDRVIGRAKYPTDVSVYRGAGTTLNKILAGLAVGDVLEDRGFMSTSSDRSIAEDFFHEPTNEDGKSVYRLMEIALTAGARAIDMPSFDTHADQSEIVLDRGTRLKLIGIEEQRAPESWIKKFVYKFALADQKAKNVGRLLHIKFDDDGHFPSEVPAPSFDRFIDAGDGLLIERTDGTRWRVGPDGELSKA